MTLATSSMAARCLREGVAPTGEDIRASSRWGVEVLQRRVVNLPGWRWATIMQFALDGSSCSLHTEVSKAHGGSFGVVHSIISVCGILRSR